jgi:hypothetical protein
MTHKLKMLGMALVAVLALTAISASAASAAKYTASTYPTTGTGESKLGNDVFTTEAGKVECKSHYSGTLKEASTDLTITLIPSECKAFGFLNATVSHCTLTFTEPTFTTADAWHMLIHITGNCIIIVSTCEVSIPAQGPLSSVSGTTETAAGDVKVKANVTGIKYNVTKDGIGCPFSGTGEKAGATFTQAEAITFDSTNGASIDVG